MHTEIDKAWFEIDACEKLEHITRFIKQHITEGK